MGRPFGKGKIDKRRLVELLNQGCLYVECAKEFGVSASSVGEMAKKLQSQIHRPFKFRADPSFVKEKVRNYRREYEKRHKKEIKQWATAGYKRRFDENMNWLLSYLGVDKLSCSRCGYNEFFCAIDEHHPNNDGKEKRKRHQTISQLLGKVSLETFKRRFLKSDTVFLCSNCHRGLHHGGWSLE